jgi:hypothetical protein
VTELGGMIDATLLGLGDAAGSSAGAGDRAETQTPAERRFADNLERAREREQGPKWDERVPAGIEMALMRFVDLARDRAVSGAPPASRAAVAMWEPEAGAAMDDPGDVDGYVWLGDDAARDDATIDDGATEPAADAAAEPATEPAADAAPKPASAREAEAPDANADADASPVELSPRNLSRHESAGARQTAAEPLAVGGALGHGHGEVRVDLGVVGELAGLAPAGAAAGAGGGGQPMVADAAPGGAAGTESHETAEAAEACEAAEGGARGHIGAQRAELVVGEGAERVTLVVSASHGGIHLRAHAVSETMRAALAHGAGELNEALGKHGLHLAELSTETSGHEGEAGTGAGDADAETDADPDHHNQTRRRGVRIVV